MTQYNHSARIPCGGGAEGSPPPTFHWTQGGMGEVERTLSQLLYPDRFSIDDGNGDLVLSVARHADSGMYQCRATNSIGTASVFINVSVLGKLLQSASELFASKLTVMCKEHLFSAAMIL